MLVVMRATAQRTDSGARASDARRDRSPEAECPSVNTHVNVGEIGAHDTSRLGAWPGSKTRLRIGRLWLPAGCGAYVLSA